MIACCIELGSHWWTWIAADADEHFAPRGAVFYSWTAILSGTSGRHCLRCWTMPGIGRSNVAGFPRAAVPTGLQHITALTDESETLRGANRLLCRCADTPRSLVDAHLVVGRSIMCGWITFVSDWKADGVQVVCTRASKGVQESLVLMPPDGAVQTAEGVCRIAWQDGRTSRRRVGLVLAYAATSGAV